MTMTEAIATVKVDDERVRVTEYRFPPGSHTGWHRHGMAYVVVPTRSGRLRLVSKDDVNNDGPGEVAFIEVEIKALAG
jgi:quercetin dioxygenase-like cupin family protein